VHSQAQNRAVNRRQPVQPPIRGVLADQFIQRRGIMRGAFKKLVRKRARLRTSFLKVRRMTPRPSMN